MNIKRILWQNTQVEYLIRIGIVLKMILMLGTKSTHGEEKYYIN